MIPPPPCDEKTWKKSFEEKRSDGEKFDSPPKTNKINGQYYNSCKEVAKEMGVAATVEYWEEIVRCLSGKTNLFLLFVFLLNCL